MNDRQLFLDRVRELTTDLQAELIKPKNFTKEIERFCVNEAVVNLKIAEKHLQSYLQVDKFRGN